MTDHKFTDDDVIKAYELCFTPKGTNETCAKCPFHKIGLLCKIERDRAALDLLYRQKNALEREIYNGLKADEEIEYLKAEIERLNAVHADMTESLRLAAEANKDMQAELKSLKHRYDLAVAEREANVKGFAETLKTIKAEAIKEFAERLKVKVGSIPQYHFNLLQVEDDINTLVEEMMETK